MQVRKICHRRSARILAIASATMIFTAAARADTFNWVGTSASNSWSTPNNWIDQTTPAQSSNAYPTDSDTAILDVDGYNYINLLSPTLSLDTLQLPGHSSYGFFGTPSTGSPPYTLSSNSGAGSTILHVNQITAGPNNGFGPGDYSSNIIDSTITLQGPDSSPLAISLHRSLDLLGPVIAPGGISVSSTQLFDTGGILNLYNSSNSISSLYLSGAVNAYGPGSIQNATVNFSPSFGYAGALTLISDLPDANYNNNINAGGSAFIRAQPATSNYQPFGDPASSIFHLGNVTISSSFPTFITNTFEVDNSQTHDILQFQNLNITGSVTLSGTNATAYNPKTVTQFSSLTGYIPPPPIVDPCGYTIGIFDPVGPSSLTIRGGEFDFAGGATTPGDITVQTGLLVAQSDASLGTGAIHVNTGGALRFDVPQSTLPTIAVDSGGAIGGNLTGAIYGQNITLADGAILFPTAGPLPSRPASGPLYWRGIDSLTSSFSAGDDGTSIYRGVAFGPFTPDGPFTGTLNEPAPNAGIQILATSYTAFGDPVSGTPATFNSSKDVTITLTGTNEVDFFQPPAGTAKVFNLYAPAGQYNLGPGTFDLLGSGVIPSGDTVNIETGTLYMFTQGDAVANGAKVNVMPGAIFAEWGNTSPTSGTFEIKPGGILSLFGGTANHGATFIFDPGSIIELNSGIDDGSWIPPQSDILISNVIYGVGNGLQLGPNQRISASLSTGDLAYTPISCRPDAPADATFKFTSASGTLQYDGLYFNAPITFGPNQTLQIGDTLPWSYDGLVPTGVVHFDNNIVTVGTLNIVSGTLLLGSPNNTPPQINASTITLSHNATLAGSGIINANQLTIAGTLAPGFSPGILQVNADTTLLHGSSYQWQINSTSSTPGLGWDLLTITGLLTIDPNASADPILISLQSLDFFNYPNLLSDFDPAQSYAFPFIEATTLANFDPADFLLDLSQFQNPYDGTWTLQQTAPGELDILYTPTSIPEPTTLLACGLTLKLLPRKPRTRSRAK